MTAKEQMRNTISLFNLILKDTREKANQDSHIKIENYTKIKTTFYMKRKIHNVPQLEESFSLHLEQG